MVVEIIVDGAFKLGDAAEYAAPDALAGDLKNRSTRLSHDELVGIK